MSKIEEIRPADWAKSKGVTSEIVVKLLKEAGVDVRSHMTKIPVSEYAPIEAQVESERAKLDSRKQKKSSSTSDADNSSTSSAPKRKVGSVSTIKGGAVKVSLKRAKPAAPKPASETKAPAAPQKPAIAQPEVVKSVESKKENVAVSTAAEVSKPVEQKPVQQKPVEQKSAEHKSVEQKSAEHKPAVAPRTTPQASLQPKKEVAPKEIPATSKEEDSKPDLKVAAMKAQVFKPDAAILARIEKSRQQQANTQHRRPNGPRSGGNNSQGYTGSFGKSPAGGGVNSNNRRPQGQGGNAGGGYRPGGNAGGGNRPYTPGGQNRSGGFSSGSMKEAFGASPSGANLVASTTTAAKDGSKSGNRRNDKKRGTSLGNKQERQKEQQDVVRQNVSRVMASLSKHPIKKVYRKELSESDGSVERQILKTSDFITVGELAGLMEQMPARVIAKCMEMGMMVTINARLDFESIQVLADEFGFEAQLMEEYEEEVLGVEEEQTENLLPRHPVVTVMGHVDHGKTSLLDWIRKANVVSGESGGITQHIGAYEVSTKAGKVTFLDTPGHEAFSAMRARGSQVTDVIVLVVAADSMVMPQTVESIELAHREKVPLVVAITKIDLPTANPDKIRTQLAERGVEVEQWGGTVSCIEVSARSGKGMDLLLETLALETEVLELKANPDTRARGAVVESKLDAGKGSMATILIQNGTLHIGDPFVCGLYSGRVRAMFDERGGIRKEAGPSTPCQVLGFDGTPQAGDDLIVVEDEKTAREIASKRRMAARERDLRARKTISLENVYEGAKDGKISELNLIVKADVGGSAEALAASLEKLSNSEVKIHIIRKGVGAITDSDILLATTSQAIVIAFHLMPSLSIREMAEKEGIEIKTYRVIYDCIEDIKNAVEGLLKPTTREEIVGEADIREVFKIPKVGLIAGCMVTSGEVNRDSRVHVYRNGVELGLTEVQSLKRHKDDVKSVARGFDCGIGLKGYDNIEVGDTLMFFKDVKVARTLADVARDEKAAAEKSAADKAASEKKQNDKGETK
ncbi:MAG: translation initiation factor IF-2 [Fibrobacter sp.]|jgi:translation initiation factor IF-2|nr:translation initiation factor IF-2 [Fibrobacter sp.]